MYKIDILNFLLICNICEGSFSLYDEDYIPIDDLPLQDARLVRADGTDRKAPNITTENPFAKSGGNEEDWTWMEDALKDIAYYLRSHKFNEYDRRYETDAAKAPRNYHLHFPRPALRNLHWEVHKFCESSFTSCIEYLWKRTKLTGLKRVDDTAIVIQEQHWTVPEHQAQIDAVEAECHKLKIRDDVLANPFQGPIERFQWRTTASYYMCWYTTNEVTALRHLAERCDNYANCSVESSSDIRASDDEPFACALYSFCPDPCCQIRHVWRSELCWDSPENPCYLANPPEHRECTFKRARNKDLREVILNHWNVSCKCPKKGYTYSSRYGICVDIDECQMGTHKCKKSDGEACLNTPGSFTCVCKWGHTWDKKIGKCTENEAIALIKMNKSENLTGAKDRKEKSYLRYLIKKLFKNESPNISINISVLLLSALLFIL